LALRGVVEVGGWRLGLDAYRPRAVVEADLCFFPVVEAGRLALELRGVERLPPFGRGVLVDVAYELLVRVLDPDERHRYRDVSAREHRKLGPGRGDTDAGYLVDAVQSRVGEQHPVAVGEGLPVNGDRRAGGQDTRESVDHLYLGDHIVSKL